jgi:hypothetical protein
MAKIVDCFTVVHPRTPSLNKLCCIGDGQEVFDLTASVERGCTLDEALVPADNEMAVLALKRWDERQKQKKEES